MLFDKTRAISRTDFLRILIFPQNQNIFVSHVDTAQELRTCCFSGGAESGTHSKRRALWILFAIGPLPVMRSYVQWKDIIRAHYCCLQRVGKEVRRKSSPRCLLPSLKMSFGCFLGTSPLWRSLQVLRDAPMAHAGFTGDQFGVFLEFS